MIRCVFVDVEHCESWLQQQTDTNQNWIRVLIAKTKYNLIILNPLYSEPVKILHEENKAYFRTIKIFRIEIDNYNNT